MVATVTTRRRMCLSGSSSARRPTVLAPYVAPPATVGLPAPDSSLAELQSIHGLADAFPFLTVHHLEHYPTADHQVGERPGCIVVMHGRAPSDIDGSTALVRLFGLKGWTISPTATSSESPFNRAAYAWLTEKGGPRAD